MHLVEILLPVYGRRGEKLPQAIYDSVRQELIDRFGGLTAHSRAPAKGLWKDGAAVDKDDIVVYEVMADELDRGWWADYRRSLERRFEQDEIVIRAQAIERL